MLGWLMQKNKSADMDAAMTKLYVSESFVKSCLDAIHTRRIGFHDRTRIRTRTAGFSREHVYSGTSEIQRNVIATGCACISILTNSAARSYSRSTYEVKICGGACQDRYHWGWLRETQCVFEVSWLASVQEGKFCRKWIENKLST